MRLEDIPKIIRDRMEIDELIFGNAFCLKKEDGTFERLDPMTVKLNPETKEFEIVCEEENHEIQKETGRSGCIPMERR